MEYEYSRWAKKPTTTHHEVRPCRELLTQFDLPEAHVTGHVIIGYSLPNPPPHVHQLKLVPLLLTHGLEVGVTPLQYVVPLLYGIW